MVMTTTTANYLIITCYPFKTPTSFWTVTVLVLCSTNFHLYSSPVSLHAVLYYITYICGRELAMVENFRFYCYNCYVYPQASQPYKSTLCANIDDLIVAFCVHSIFRKSDKMP